MAFNYQTIIEHKKEILNNFISEIMYACWAKDGANYDHWGLGALQKVDSVENAWDCGELGAGSCYLLMKNLRMTR